MPGMTPAWESSWKYVGDEMALWWLSDAKSAGQRFSGMD